MNASPSRRWDYFFLLAFAFTAVASIALQNLIWVAVFIFFLQKRSQRQSIKWPTNPFALTTLLFLASFFIGAALGIDPFNSFQTIHKYLVFLVLFPIGAMVFHKNDIHKLFDVFILGASVCSIYGIVYKHFILHNDRIDSFSGDKMVFSGLLMISIIMTMTQWKNTNNHWVYGIALALIGTALILTGTRGAWLGTIVGAFILAWRMNKSWILVGSIALIGLFFLLPQSYQERAKSIFDIHFSYTENMKDNKDNGKIRNATQSRMLIWVSGWHIIKDYPFGFGQGNLDKIYQKYRFDLPAEELETHIPHLHNNFIQITAQNGWLGLGAYLFWIFTFYRESLRYKNSDSQYEDWNWMMICVFSSVLVWGLSEYTFSQQFSTAFAFLLGLQMALWKQEPSL